MALELKHDPEDRVLTVTISGTLQAEDYKKFGPVVEDLIRKEGKVDVLLLLYDFHGWTAGALWEDIKFDTKHFRDIGKIAMVGDRKWEQGMATVCKPFTTAQIKYFDKKDVTEARKWIGVGRHVAANAP